MRRGARTPEELETLLEDAFVLRSGEAIAELFEDVGVLVADDGIREAHGLDEIARLASQMWQCNCSYLAEPGRIVQAGNTALIMTMHGANVVRRGTDGAWRYAIALLPQDHIPPRRTPMVQQASTERDILSTIQDQDDLVEALRSGVDGQVLTTDNAEYDEARTPYFPVRIGKPVAVVRPKHVDDVAIVVDAARRTGLPLFVRSGAHHAAAHSTGDGLLIDLRSLNNLDIDVAGQTAWAETGLTAREVAWALEPHGLAVGFGDIGSVGIGGLTLGGGIGFLSRLYGMTIDNVLAAEIVTADGRVHIVDHVHEPDLFWAICGGGGNFGVVTKFWYRLATVQQVYGGPLILPATPAAISRLAQACAEADDALTVIPIVMPAPPMPFIPAEMQGQLVIRAVVCYAGDLQRAEEALQPLREIATPVLDLVQPMPYAVLMDEETPVRGHPMALRSMFLDHIDDSVGATILEGLNRSDSWLPFVQFRVLGGAISRVAPDATAYAHRKSPIMAIVARPLEDDELAARQWTEELAVALYQGYDGAYVNFLGPHDRDRIGAAYPGETLARLRRIKATYDPTNLFRNNDNITPA